MFVINLDKYSRNEDIRIKLINTGNKYLEETNYWGDKIWGVCDNMGLNYLGKVLMAVRSHLQKIEAQRLNL